MLDPRDPSRDRDVDARHRAYARRERSDDPRDALLHDLDLEHRTPLNAKVSLREDRVIWHISDEGAEGSAP